MTPLAVLAGGIGLVATATLGFLVIRASDDIVHAGDVRGTIATPDGRQRTYLLHLPPQTRTGSALPLVVALHGGGGAADIMRAETGFDFVADREGFIVLYPNGTSAFENLDNPWSSPYRTWNGIECCNYALENQIDDIGFLRALIERVAREYPVDRDRIFVTGFSNGAMLAYLAGCELSDTVAAIAPVSGHLPRRVECKPTGPVSLITFKEFSPERYAYQESDGAVRWAALHECGKGEEQEEIVGPGGKVRTQKLAWYHCRNGVKVRAYLYVGLAHAWPRGRIPGLEGTVTEEIWEFFRTQTEA